MFSTALVLPGSNVLHGGAMSQKSTLVRSVGLSLLPVCLLSLSAACSGVIDPDPYTGTIDPSAFDKQYKFQPASREDPVNGCLLPRRGWDGASLSDSPRFYYLGALFAAQLDLAGAFDTTRALPASVYSLSGCNAPEGRKDPGEFDIRVNNYDRRVQYPILSQGLFPVQVGAAGEPTAQASYKPFHLVVQVQLETTVRDRMGCNDVKRELSLLERAGWDRATKTFPDTGPKDFDFAFPSREQIRSGAVRFKDWPMVNVGVPVGRSLDPIQSCPFVTGSKAVYPQNLSDSAAGFQFPSQAWFRGLLSGYVDGGDLPLITEARKCPALFDSGKSCKIDAMGMVTGCSVADGEVCTATDPAKSGTCLVPPPVCPVINELYVSKDEFDPPSASSFDSSDPLPRSKSIVTLTDAMDMTKTRKADALAMFAVSAGQPNYSPVCRVRWVDLSRATCAAKENQTIKPRPLCTIAELQASTGAILPTAPGKDVFVHCLSLAAAK